LIENPKFEQVLFSLFSLCFSPIKKTMLAPRSFALGEMSYNKGIKTQSLTLSGGTFLPSKHWVLYLENFYPKFSEKLQRFSYNVLTQR
jgi:hypothetical protein